MHTSICIKVARFFGETDFEDFFIIFDEFLTSFVETLNEIKLKKVKKEIENDYATLKIKEKPQVMNFKIL